MGGAARKRELGNEWSDVDRRFLPRGQPEAGVANQVIRARDKRVPIVQGHYGPGVVELLRSEAQARE